MIDRNSPAAQSVPRRKRASLDLVDVIFAWLARPDRGLDRVDLVNVNDGLLSVAADAVREVCLLRSAENVRCSRPHCPPVNGRDRYRHP
jgi:hypothetical protein